MHTRRLATDLPLAPIVVVPETRVNTEASRGRLPASVSHADAAAASAQAALLGAAVAAGDAELLAAAFHDKLHEPYRVEDAPLLARAPRRPGARHGRRHALGLRPVRRRLGREGRRGRPSPRRSRARLPDAQVLPLAIATQGAAQV